jgi:Ca2+-binding EF-hand superfamily protein
MYISKIILLASVFCLVITGSVFAQSPSKGAVQAGNSKEIKGCPPYEEKGRTYDSSPIPIAIDSNLDGILTHEEWLTAGAPEGSWNKFMNKYDSDRQKGYLTIKEFIDDSPPDGIDKNCDGFITIWEFRATVKGCPQYSKEGRTYNAIPIVNAIDGNKDGIMTHEEWTAAGAPEGSFQGFIKKSGKDYVTKQEFLAETPPNGIDKNCDGYITIWEFRNTAISK